MTKVADLVGPVRQALLVRAKDHHPDAFIDQWLHIQYTLDGRRYRYKFQKTTVRREVKGPQSGQWVRLKTHAIKHLAEKLL